MCVILDASVRDNVFGTERTSAGEQFFNWLETSRARLVVGGELFTELAGSANFAKWAEIAIADGRVWRVARKEVEREMASLSSIQRCKSNDEHVIALARVSKARILYSDDGNLCNDFKNPALVPRPHGRLYPTGESQNARRHRRQLLNQPNLCPNR